MRYSIYSEDLMRADNSYEFDVAFYKSDVFEYNPKKYSIFIEIKDNKLYQSSNKRKQLRPYCYGDISFYPEIKAKVDKINLPFVSFIFIFDLLIELSTQITISSFNIIFSLIY
jgi:hypothetical protein